MSHPDPDTETPPEHPHTGSTTGWVRRYIQATLGATSGVVPVLSAGLAGGLALLALAGVGYTTDYWPAIGIGITGGVALGIGIAGTDLESPVVALLAPALLVGGLGAIIGWPVIAVRAGTPMAGGLTVAAGLVGLGLSRFRLASLSKASIIGTLRWLIRVFGMISIGGLILAVVSIDLNRVRVASVLNIDIFLTPQVPEIAVLTFIAVTWMTAFVLWAAVAAMPIADLAPATHTDRLREIEQRIERTITYWLGAGGVLLPIGYYVGTNSQPEWAWPLMWIGEFLGGIVFAPGLRELLLRIGVLGGLCWGIVTVFRWGGRRMIGGNPRGLISVGVWAGGLLLGAWGIKDWAVETAVELAVASQQTTVAQTLTELQTTIGPGALTVGGVGAVIAGVWLLLAGAVIGGVFGVLPDRTAGPRLVSLGVLTGVLVGARAGQPTTMIFIGVVIAVLIWDIAEHGIGLVDALGDQTVHRRSQLVHAVGSLTVGGVTIIGMSGLQWLLAGEQLTGTGVMVTLLCGTVAAVILTLVLRG